MRFARCSSARASATSTVCMNFLAMPTLKNVRACLRLPISMMPRFSLKLTLARLRTGIDSAGSRLRSAAVITMSATPTSFFSTGPIFFGVAPAMARSIASCAWSTEPRRACRLSLRVRSAWALRAWPSWALTRCRPGPGGRLQARDLALPPRRRRPLGFRRALRVRRRARSAPGSTGASPSGPSGVTMIECGRPSGPPPSRPRISSVRLPPVRFMAIFWSWLLSFSLGELAALQPGAGLDDLLDVELEDVAPAELALGPLAPPQEDAEPAPALLERELDLLADLVVVGDRFLGLAGERHPDRGHVDEDHHRARPAARPGTGTRRSSARRSRARP